MKDKVNQLFKDKLFLVMMVIGLLTAVAAVGVLTVQMKMARAPIWKYQEVS